MIDLRTGFPFQNMFFSSSAVQFFGEMGVWWLCSCEPLGPKFWVRCAPSFPPSGTTASSDGTKEDWYVTAILVRFGNFEVMLATLLIVDNPISTWDFSATWCRRVQNSAANRQGYRVTKPFPIWRFVNPVYVQEKRCGFSRDPKIPPVSSMR